MNKSTLPPPPPGKGPGRILPNGEVYYPMLPEIPLSPDGAGMREEVSMLVLEWLECAENDPSQLVGVVSQVRELVGGSPAAFGLSEQRYAEMDDEKLHQYLLDITG